MEIAAAIIIASFIISWSLDKLADAINRKEDSHE